MGKKKTTKKCSSQKTNILKKTIARKQKKVPTNDTMLTKKIVERGIQQEHTADESIHKRNLYAAYLEKLKVKLTKEFVKISKETVMVELQKRKDARINNTLHVLSDARGVLFYHQTKELSN